MLVCRNQIAQIGAVDYVFESRQHPNPDVRPPFAGNKSIEIVCEIMDGNLSGRTNSDPPAQHVTRGLQLIGVADTDLTQ